MRMEGVMGHAAAPQCVAPEWRQGSGDEVAERVFSVVVAAVAVQQYL